MANLHIHRHTAGFFPDYCCRIEEVEIRYVEVNVEASKPVRTTLVMLLTVPSVKAGRAEAPSQTSWDKLKGNSTNFTHKGQFTEHEEEYSASCIISSVALEELFLACKNSSE